MKFKTTSILGLIFPLSVALVLSAFLGCGAGGSPYGNASSAYDGTWDLNLKGYTIPTPVAPATAVSCGERPTYIVIAHGQGTVTETIDCVDQTNAELAAYPKIINIGVTLKPDAASGITGTVTLETTGGGPTPSTGVCIDRVTCTAGNPGAGLSMFKCGTAAASC